MSFDLYFKANGEKQPGAGDFCAYFGNRKWYNVENNQAWYENQDTQVYFSFQWGDEASELSEDDEIRNSYPPDLLSLDFRLNFLRPCAFCLEAAIELEAFVVAHNLLVFDPQTEPSSVEGFSNGTFRTRYDKSNQRAIEATGEEMPEVLASFHRMSKQVLASTWKWNYSRHAISQREIRDIYVPIILYLLVAGRVRSAVVWTDAIPIVIPEVDLIIIHREDLLPHRLFEKAIQNCLVQFDAIRDLICDYPSGNHPIRHWTLAYDRSQEEISGVFSRVHPEVDAFEIVPFDSILDAEV